MSDEPQQPGVVEVTVVIDTEELVEATVNRLARELRLSRAKMRSVVEALRMVDDSAGDVVPFAPIADDVLSMYGYAPEEKVSDLQSEVDDYRNFAALAYEAVEAAAKLLPYAKAQYEQGIEMLSIRAVSDVEVAARREECVRRYNAFVAAHQLVTATAAALPTHPNPNTDNS